MLDIWYRLSNGQTEGPLTLMDLQRMAEAGALKPGDSISPDGASWRPAGEVAEINFAAGTPHALNYPAPAQDDVLATPRVIELLRQTSPWVRIMSIVMFVSCGLMFIGGPIIIVVGQFAPSRGSDPNPALLGLLYIVMAILYIAPAIFLHRYASRAKAFAKLRSEQELEEAMQAQKSFWKYIALLTLIMVSLYLLAIPVFIIYLIVMHH